MRARANQTQTWASGRYLDGMTIAFFLAGAVVLLRAGLRPILACAACVTALFVLAAVTVAIYAGSSLPTVAFGSAFNFAEPAVLTQNWTQASVLLATTVALGLLAAWITLALAARRWRAVPGFLDRAPVLQPGQPAARRCVRGREVVAGWPAGAGQLAARPGRLAGRGHQPGRPLGPVAEGLTGIPGLAADRAPVAVAGAWILMRVRTGEFLAWVALARFCERGQHPSRGRYSR